MQYGIAVEEGEEFDSDGLVSIRNLTSYCAGLVVIDERSGLVSLVHPTTNEYFVKHKDVLLPAADDLIAVACTTYLLMHPLSSEGACLKLDEFIQRYNQHPLLGYAAVNWGSHVRLSANQESLRLSRRLLKDQRARSAVAQALILNAARGKWNIPEWPELSGTHIDAEELTAFENSKKFVGALHLASYFGLTEIVQSLLEDDNKINELDGMGGTAVHWAILGNQNDSLRLLLERGANVDVMRERCHLRRWTTLDWDALNFPLRIAAWQDNTEALRLLQSNGAIDHEIISSHSINVSALSLALHEQHNAAAIFLLRNRAGAQLHINDFCLLLMKGTVEMLRVAIDTELLTARVVALKSMLSMIETNTY